LFEDLQASPPTWPKSGTWDLGAACEHPMSVPATAGSASSSSPGLLKTPTAQLAVNGGSQHPDKRRAGGHGPTLADQVECELLPTPAARDWKSGQSNLIGTNARPLNEVVEMLLPTLRATDGSKWGPSQSSTGGDSLPTAIVDLLPTLRASDTGTPGRRASEGWGAPLSQVLLPTPTAMDSHGSRNATANRSSVKPTTNNDGWTLSDVFWTGESTPSPSGGRSGSSAAPLPGQLSLDGLESA